MVLTGTFAQTDSGAMSVVSLTSVSIIHFYSTRRGVIQSQVSARVDSEGLSGEPCADQHDTVHQQAFAGSGSRSGRVHGRSLHLQEQVGDPSPQALERAGGPPALQQVLLAREQLQQLAREHAVELAHRPLHVPHHVQPLLRTQRAQPQPLVQLQEMG